MSITCPIVRHMQVKDPGFQKYLRLSRITTRDLMTARLHEHHVWPGERANLQSNLIYINSYAHDYLHKLGGPELRIAGIWARSRQPGFSWDELDSASGRDVRDWLELDKCEGLPRPYCDWRKELIGGH